MEDALVFRDRRDAGRRLAERLRHLAGAHPLVLGLPRGGVPVGGEVARALEAPLDVFLVRKLGVPGHEELAFGAIASGATRVLNDDVVDLAGLGEEAVAAVTAREEGELARRERAYRGDRPRPDVQGRVVIVVDDGLATGASMRAAVEALRAQGAARIVVAVPVAPRETCALLGELADEVVCLRTPEPFRGVGAWYGDFSQTSDAEVQSLVAEARGGEATAGAGGGGRSRRGR